MSVCKRLRLAPVLLIVSTLVLGAACRATPAQVSTRLVDMSQSGPGVGNLSGDDSAPQDRMAFLTARRQTLRPSRRRESSKRDPASATSRFAMGSSLDGRRPQHQSSGWNARRDSRELDDLHAIEIRLRVTEGSTLLIGTNRGEDVDLEQIPAQLLASPFRIESPIVAGEEFQTYTLTSPVPVPATAIRHLIVVPTNEVGAEFEISSVRIVFRKEHLVSIPSGLGWYGLGEIYRETLVARSPEAPVVRRDARRSAVARSLAWYDSGGPPHLSGWGGPGWFG